MTVTRVPPPFLANLKQAELARAWRDPTVDKVLIAGAIRTGKTQGAGRLIVETAIAHPAMYLVARCTYRELEDSTKRAILLGDGDLPPLLPMEVRAQYRASDNKVVLRNGSEILFRSLEEGQIGKILNLTLGGIFIDQIEELDPGSAGENLFDTILGRLSHPSGPRKLVAVANPASTMHWVHRRFVDPETRDPDARYIHVTMRDNAENLPPGYVEKQEATRETRPHWFRTYVLGEWGAFEGAAYPMYDENVHVVPPFDIPAAWERFEHMDFGTTNPTAWYVQAVDYDGNLIVVDGLYRDGHESANLPSTLCPEVFRLRREGWEARDDRDQQIRNTVWADPSIWNNSGTTGKFGQPASVGDEFLQEGLPLVRASKDRVAGYVRTAELLTQDADHAFPAWHNQAGEKKSPRLFIFDVPGTAELREQLQSAPIEEDGEPHPGEAVSRRWEGPYGHAHASLRYGVMSRPSPSTQPKKVSEDPRRAFLDQISERENDPPSRRYRNV